MPLAMHARTRGGHWRMGTSKTSLPYRLCPVRGTAGCSALTTALAWRARVIRAPSCPLQYTLCGRRRGGGSRLGFLLFTTLSSRIKTSDAARLPRASWMSSIAKATVFSLNQCSFTALCTAFPVECTLLQTQLYDQFDFGHEANSIQGAGGCRRVTDAVTMNQEHDRKCREREWPVLAWPIFHISMCLL